MKALGAALTILAGTTIAAPVVAQSDYPQAAIRFINASSAGGASDIFARSVAEELSKQLKQPVIIENRPGGGFNIASRACADAAPDGYTFCVLPGEPLGTAATPPARLWAGSGRSNTKASSLSWLLRQVSRRTAW